MAQSVTLTDVATLQAYVQDFHPELIRRAFYSPKTLQYGTAHEGVKGKKALTKIKFVAGKAVSWAGAFSAASGALTMHPRQLEVVPIKRDLSFIPQEFEATYLGKFRRMGQNPGQDLPFEADILNTLLAGHAEELESAYWQGVQAGSVTPGTTPMAQCFDGFLHIISDAITATTLSAVPTPGGAITTTNIIELLETMWDSLGAGYKEGPVHVFLSWANYQKYQQAYREAYGKYTAQGNNVTALDFSQNALLVPMPGMGTSNRIVMTPGENLCVGYDGLNDQMFNFLQLHRQIDFWMDFKAGVNFAQIDEECLVVNDLT